MGSVTGKGFTMKRKQVEALREFLEQVNPEGGRIDKETLSKAILRAVELVIEEHEESHRRMLESWNTPLDHQDPVSRVVLRIANLFPGRPMLNGLLCGVILIVTVTAVETPISFCLERWHLFSGK